MGIEGLKAVLGLAFSLTELGEMIVNKQWNSLWGKVIELVPKAQDFWKYKAELIPQYLDLDEEEKKVLIEWCKVDLDLENDKIEEYIEKGLELALHLSKVVQIVIGFFQKS